MTDRGSKLPLSPSQYDHGDDYSQDKSDYVEDLENSRDEGIAVNELTVSNGWSIVRKQSMEHVNNLGKAIFAGKKEASEIMACIHTRKGILLVLELADEFVKEGESAALRLNSSES